MRQGGKRALLVAAHGRESGTDRLPSGLLGARAPCYPVSTQCPTPPIAVTTRASRAPRRRPCSSPCICPTADDLEFRSSVEELERLVSTLGYRTVAKVTQVRSHLEAGAVLGEGKLEELGELTGGDGHIGTTAPKKKDKARLKRQAAEAAARRRRRGGRDGRSGGARARSRRPARPQGRPRRRRPRSLAEPGAQPRARDGLPGARPHRRHHRDLPPAREEPRGAPPGRDRAPQLHGAAHARVTRRQGAAAGPRRRRGRARARSPQGARPHRRAARRSSTPSSAIRTCAARTGARRGASRSSATRTPASPR